MGNDPSRAIHQSFLPGSGVSRAHVWKFSLEYGGRRPRHFHAEPELNLIVAGTATFGIGETVVNASAGELLGFPPGQDHVLLDSSPDLYLFAIGLEPNFSAKVLRLEQDNVTVPLHVRLSASDLRALESRSAKIVDQTGVEQESAELWEHANWLRQRHVGRLNDATHVLTRRTLSLLADDPDIDREQLASKLRASPFAISRYFHHDVGLTLVRYRTRLRLMRFMRLVDEGNENLTLAAKAAGFGSYSQCHRVFQSELGCAPRQFFLSGVRQQMQQAYEP
jgi:AraC-like DNA-binding protein/quercetin dioxygenase-like cupin family protein